MSESNYREEMEVRLVAMLLGEASAFEAAELQAALEKDPSLAAFYAEMQGTISQVTKAVGKPEPANSETPKLSADRREKLLQSFKVVSVPKTTKAKKARRWLWRLSWAAGLILVVGLGVYNSDFLKHRPMDTTNIPGHMRVARSLEALDVAPDSPRVPDLNAVERMPLPPESTPAAGVPPYQTSPSPQTREDRSIYLPATGKQTEAPESEMVQGNARHRDVERRKDTGSKDSAFYAVNRSAAASASDSTIAGKPLESSKGAASVQYFGGVNSSSSLGEVANSPAEVPTVDFSRRSSRRAPATGGRAARPGEPAPMSAAPAQGDLDGKREAGAMSQIQGKGTPSLGDAPTMGQLFSFVDRNNSEAQKTPAPQAERWLVAGSIKGYYDDNGAQTAATTSTTDSSQSTAVNAESKNPSHGQKKRYFAGNGQANNDGQLEYKTWAGTPAAMPANPEQSEQASKLSEKPKDIAAGANEKILTLEPLAKQEGVRLAKAFVSEIVPKTKSIPPANMEVPAVTVDDEVQKSSPAAAALTPPPVATPEVRGSYEHLLDAGDARVITKPKERDAVGQSLDAAGVASTEPAKPKMSLDSARQVQSAKFLYESGHYNEAESQLKEVIQSDPGNSAANYYMDLVKEGQSGKRDRTHEVEARAKIAEVSTAWLPVDKSVIPGTQGHEKAHEPGTQAGTPIQMGEMVAANGVSEPLVADQKVVNQSLSEHAAEGKPLGRTLASTAGQQARENPATVFSPMNPGEFKFKLQKWYGSQMMGGGMAGGGQSNPKPTNYMSGLQLLGLATGVTNVAFDEKTGRITAQGDAQKLKGFETALRYLEEKVKADGFVNEPADQSTNTPQNRPAPQPVPVPQPEISTKENAFSTFSLNVSDVSYKLAVASLQSGTLPDPASIRVEEFVNAFNYRDPAPRAGARLAFAWEQAHDPFAHNRDLLRFGIQTAARGREVRKPLNLVVLLDNSGSMERADRVEIVHKALAALARQLQPQDRVSVVAFARTAQLWIDGMSGGHAEEFLKKVLELNPDGGTNLEDALHLGYATALSHFMASGMNRVILLTDGAANLGNIDSESLKQIIVHHRQIGIAFDCFGIGWESYNDDLLEVLSRNGDGRYGFLNKPEQAEPEFANQLAGALNVAASDVKAQVEFNPDRVVSWRQIGYAKHQLTKEQFRDNTVDAAEIAAAEQGNALYVVEINPNGSGPIGTMRVRFKSPDTGEYREEEWPLDYSARVTDLDQASPAMRLSGGASAFGEWLSRSPYAADVKLSTLESILSGIPAVYSPDPRPNELVESIHKARMIEGQ